jgi:hypothetical protein
MYYIKDMMRKIVSNDMSSNRNALLMSIIAMPSWRW